MPINIANTNITMAIPNAKECILNIRAHVASAKPIANHKAGENGLTNVPIIFPIASGSH